MSLFPDIPSQYWQNRNNTDTTTNINHTSDDIIGSSSGGASTRRYAHTNRVGGELNTNMENYTDTHDDYDRDLDPRYNPYVIDSAESTDDSRYIGRHEYDYIDNEHDHRPLSFRDEGVPSNRNMNTTTAHSNSNNNLYVSSLYNDDVHANVVNDDPRMMDPHGLSENTNPTVLFDSGDVDDIAGFDDGTGNHHRTGAVNYHLVERHSRLGCVTSGNNSPNRNSKNNKKHPRRKRSHNNNNRKKTTNNRTRRISPNGKRNSNNESNHASANTGSNSNTAQQRNVSLQELIHTLGGRSTNDGAGLGSCLGSNRTPNQHVVEPGERPAESDLSLLHPTLERRVRDFRFAQRKRREKYGVQKRWGVFGLYQHLADIRLDLEWAEDAAWRRIHMEPYLRWTDYENSRNKGMNNQPFFTYITITICTAMLITTIGLNAWKLEPLNINPLLGPSAEVLIQSGARETMLIVEENEWYRLFSPLILHAGIIHWFINMLALYFIGGAVEQSHGFLAALILFVVPAVGGNILSAIFLPQYISVGASGGIFGLIGACIADITINWNLLFIRTDEEDNSTRLKHTGALLWLLVDIIVNCLIGLTPFVDNFTHLGGLFYGVCCGLSTIDRVGFGFLGGFLLSQNTNHSQDNTKSGMIDMGKWSKIRNDLLRFCGLIFSVCLIMVTTALLIDSNGEVTPCPSCRYVSCVPFPFWLDSSNRWWNCDDCDFAVADLVKINAENVYYDRIDLTCPDGDISIVDISDDNQGDREVIRRQLPSYCRQYCDDVYISSNP